MKYSFVGPIKIGYPEFIVTVLAFFALAFNYTFVQEIPQIASDVNFSIELILGGIVLSLLGDKILGKLVTVDEAPFTEEKQQGMLFSYAMSFVGSILVGIFTPLLPALSTTTVSLSALYGVAATYAILNAVGEEWTFRGFLGNLILAKTGRFPAFGCAIDGLVFMLFHLFVYGNDPASLVGTFIGGTLICYADYRTKRLLTGMLTHISINLVASGLTVVRPVAVSLMLVGFIPFTLVIPIIGISILASFSIYKLAPRKIIV